MNSPFASLPNRISVATLVAAILLPASLLAAEEPIDRARAKAIYDKSQTGATLTDEERTYLERAKEEMRRQNGKTPQPPPPPAATGDRNGILPPELPSTGLKPLTEMTGTDRYKGEDGGLYGGGKNEPTPVHQALAVTASRQITPLDAQGQPSPDGKVVFISLGMSNTFGEFRIFKDLADRDADKSPKVLIVNCAVGGAGVSSWAKPRSGTWQQVDARLKEAGVTPAQVQAAWIKHAEPGPTPDTSELQYAKQVSKDLSSSLEITRSTFPNLRVAYLSSRIYGGYNVAGIRRVNPEPFAYETAFSVRWVIQNQMRSEQPGIAPRPVLLWGPYLWADGIIPRKSDGLAWERKDLSNDGVHPSPAGGEKVAKLLLNFFKSDRNTRTWFSGQAR